MMQQLAGVGLHEYFLPVSNMLPPATPFLIALADIEVVADHKRCCMWHEVLSNRPKTSESSYLELVA
jgi:hypothetical protein